jgi:hypothetical protein
LAPVLGANGNVPISTAQTAPARVVTEMKLVWVGMAPRDPRAPSRLRSAVEVGAVVDCVSPHVRPTYQA